MVFYHSWTTQAMRDLSKDLHVVPPVMKLEICIRIPTSFSESSEFDSQLAITYVDHDVHKMYIL